MTPIGTRLLRFWMAAHVLVYRLSRGRLLNIGDHIILLSTLGRRSGQLRTAPLYSVRDGDSYVVIGSYGGGETHPAWYHNVQSRPRALVADRGRTLLVRAESVTGAEYDRLWGLLCAANPAYERYRGRTARVLPIVRLRP